MIYPEFIKENETVGICAPSAGVGNDIPGFRAALGVIKSNGYKIKETKTVRTNSIRSASGKQRAKEFHELVENKKVKQIIFAAGGDFNLEMLPYVDFDLVAKNPKWMIGASDPTNLLFPITTMLDIATFYGGNARAFDTAVDNDIRVTESFIKGKLVKQKSYKKWFEFIPSKTEDFSNPLKVNWYAKKPIKVSGRCIGGCLECIEKIIGTKFDKVNDFIDKYKEDGIIWYLDVFSDSAYQMYLSLLQFKNAGWFKHTKAVIIGRPAFPVVDDPKFDYQKAADKALGSIPHIMNCDIGHTRPYMTMINGAILDLEYNNSKASLSFKLK